MIVVMNYFHKSGQEPMPPASKCPTTGVFGRDLEEDSEVIGVSWLFISICSKNPG